MSLWDVIQKYLPKDAPYTHKMPLDVMSENMPIRNGESDEEYLARLNAALEQFSPAAGKRTRKEMKLDLGKILDGEIHYKTKF